MLLHFSTKPHALFFFVMGFPKLNRIKVTYFDNLVASYASFENRLASTTSIAG